MYTFLHTFNKELIKTALFSSNNKEWLFDDLHKIDNFDTFDPLNNDKIMYIACYKENQYMGIFALLTNNKITEAHLAFLPCAYGQVADIGKECLSYLWKNTEIQEIVAPIVENNKKARNCIEKMGLKERCTVKNIWQKHKVLNNIVFYNIFNPYNNNERVEKQ